MQRYIHILIYFLLIHATSVSQNTIIAYTNRHHLYQEIFNKIIPTEPQELYTFLNSFTIYASRLNMMVENMLGLNLAEKEKISCDNKSFFETYTILLDHELKKINISLEQVKDSYKLYKIQYFGAGASLKDKSWANSKINLAFKEASKNGINSAIKKYGGLKCGPQQSIFFDTYTFSKESIDAHPKEFQAIYKLPINKLSPLFSTIKDQHIVIGFCKVLQIINRLPYDFSKKSEYYLLNYKKREAKKRLSQKLKKLAPHVLKWSNDNFKVLYQLHTLNESFGSNPDTYKNNLYFILDHATKAFKKDLFGKRFGLLTAYNIVHDLLNLSHITKKETIDLNHKLTEILKEILSLEQKNFKPDVKLHLELVNCLAKSMSPIAGQYLVQTAENVDSKDLSFLELILNEVENLKQKKLLSLQENKKICQIISQKKSL